MLPLALSVLALAPDGTPRPFALTPPTTVGTRWTYETKRRPASDDGGYDYGAVRWTVAGSAGDDAVAMEVETFARLDDEGEPLGKAISVLRATLPLVPSDGVLTSDELSKEFSPTCEWPLMVPDDAGTVEAGGRVYEVLERDRLTYVPGGTYRCLVLRRSQPSDCGEGTVEIEDRLAEGVGLVWSRTRLLTAAKPRTLAEVELAAFDPAPSPPLTEEEIAALPAELYPTAVGTSWQYEEVDRTAEGGPGRSRFAARIVRNGELDGRPAWVTEFRYGADRGLLGRLLGGAGKSVASEWGTYDPSVPGYLIDRRDDAAAGQASERAKLESPTLFAFWPPRVGAKYDGDGGTEAVVDVRRATVSVPAGVFDCIRVETVQTGGGSEDRTVGYWSPGVGQVKLESVDEDGRVLWEQTLADYRAGET